MNQAEIEQAVANHNPDDEEQTVLCQEEEGRLSIQFNNLPFLCKSNAREVHDNLKKFMSKETDVVVDLGGIINIDAQGLALLIHFNKKLKKVNSQLAISNASLGIRKILNVTEIDRLIKIHEDDESRLSLPGNPREDRPANSRIRGIPHHNSKKYK